MPVREEHMQSEAARFVILDRDGVINRDSPDYIKSPDEWIPIPGSLEAIARLNHAGFTVVVATNQSGVGRGLFTINDLNAIHEKFQRALDRVGGHVDGIFFCPHTPEARCGCRKPEPGLLEAISARCGFPLAAVPVIGDSARDAQAAIAVGARPIMVRTGKGAECHAAHPELHRYDWYDDLATATCYLIDDRASSGPRG
jgi:D-glycero-D-manno-heptose 1,7-bisphosphate phosphatase